MTRHIYQLDDGETHCYSAIDETDALKQHALLTHDSTEAFLADFPETTVKQLPDDLPLAVTCIDDRPEDVPEATRIDEAGRPVVEKTCAQWASDGPGCVSTSVC